MIVVTGGSGLLGSHVVKELNRQGKQVKALYHSTKPENAGLQNVQWIKGDILDVVQLDEIMRDVQQVYHCAGAVSFNPKNKKKLYKTNVEGTANVVNASLKAGVSKLVFVSSVAALGRIREKEAITEKMNWTEETSNSEYGKTKYLAEMEVWRGIGEGLNAVIVNPVIILGAGNWEKGSSEIFKSAYNEFPWYTDGMSGFVDVQDVTKAMLLLMDSDITAERFIISSENWGFKEVFSFIATQFGKKPPYKKVTPFIAAIVWRLEWLKSKFMGKDPLLTKETAKTAQAKVRFDNTKLLQRLPNFKYTPLKESIVRICSELKEMHKL